MNRAALLVLTGALLTASPAHADFFKDLGDALGQLGDTIEETVDKAITPKPAETPAPAPVAPPPGEINWNAPPPTTEFSGATLYTPPASTRPPSLPARRRNFNATVSPPQNNPELEAASVAATTTSAGVSVGRNGQPDDAPPPRRAPRRARVEASVIAPLPGFTQAPPRAAATYSPVLAATSLADRQVANVAGSRDLPARTPAATATPAAAPAAVAAPVPAANREFVVTYSSFRARISDTLVGSTSVAPGGDSRLLVEAISASLKRDPSQRVKLQSQAIAVADRTAEARKRSFDRALLIKSWLEAAGTRPTQIDLEVKGAGEADQVALNVYKP